MPNKKVVVGMSGGVDSSVAAFLLKEQGYDVIGVTMQIWQEDRALTGLTENGGVKEAESAEGEVPDGKEVSGAEDAANVAKVLGIPHYIVDFRDIFREKIVDHFISEYIAGNTPNPCIRCNRYVKWEALLAYSMEQGADYIATGHYARIRQLENGRYAVCKSATDEKDQTYALYGLTQHQLAHTLMPLGEYRKEEIRQIAVRAGLPVADKPDSQEICFIPDHDYGAFLGRHATVPQAGNFVDKAGNILGRHEGIHKYTIGQRKGLNIAFGQPMYVCEICPATNEVVLGSNEDTFTESLICHDINYMAAENFEAYQRRNRSECVNGAEADKSGEPSGWEMTAKIRYGSREYPCAVEYLDKDILKCHFAEKVRAATPGQAIVFYQGNVVLGGGTIIRDEEEGRC